MERRQAGCLHRPVRPNSNYDDADWSVGIGGDQGLVPEEKYFKGKGCPNKICAIPI